MFRSHRKLWAMGCALLVGAMLATRVQADEVKPDAEAVRWMQLALDRWEDVCRRHLRLPVEPLAWVIFYDNNYAWHISAEKKLLPAHETATVTLNFAGQPYELLRVAHKQGLWVPGRDEALPLKVDLTAMPYADDQKAFCIIPLPAMFHKLEGLGTAAEMDELFLGVAQHELTHTRQLSFVMAGIKRLSKRYPVPEHLDDNLLEDTFGKNKVYVRSFNREMDALGNAYMADTPAQSRRDLARALTMIQQRRARYFVGKRKVYAPLEEIFLALEGAAMWAQFQMARDHAPAGETMQTTLMTLAQRMNAWSQVESLALFLLIDRLVPDWQARYFAPNPPSPFAVLQEALRQKRAAAKARK
ncbi:MAG: hypothetical protein U0Y68_12990 [Blastocatellia bacterium]